MIDGDYLWRIDHFHISWHLLQYLQQDFLFDVGQYELFEDTFWFPSFLWYKLNKWEQLYQKAEKLVHLENMFDHKFWKLFFKNNLKLFFENFF